MKRPLACAGFGALAASSAAALFHAPSVALAAVCVSFAAALFCLRLFFGKAAKAACLFMLSAAVAASFYSCVDILWRDSLVSKYDGQKVSFCATITEAPFTYGTTSFFTVKTTQINGRNERLNIKVSTDALPKGGAFDIVSGECELSGISYDDDCIDYTAYCNARHIFLETYVSMYDDAVFEYSRSNVQTFEKQIFKFREKITNALFSLLSYDEASLCCAVLTGQRQYIDSHIKTEFRSLGIMHIIVVSGLHLAIIAGIIFKLTDMFIKNKYVSCAVRFSGVTLFAASTGFGFPVRRALIVFLAAILSQLFDSRSDPINTLGLAAIILCIDPYSGGDIGLLWSFSAAASQVIFGSVSDRRPDKWFVSLLLSSIAGVIGSLPFVLLMAGVVSPYTIAANLLVVPVTGVMIVCAGAVGLLSLVSVKIAVLPAMAAGLVSRYILTTADRLSSLPYAFIAVGDKFYFYCVVSAFAAVLCAYLITRSIRIVKRCTAVILTAITILFAARIICNANICELSVINSPNGAFAVITTPYGCGIAACSGTYDNYGNIKAQLLPYVSPDFIIDTSLYGYKNDYGRRLSYDFDPGVVFCANDVLNRKCYSWYRHSGGEVIGIGDNFSYDFENGRIDVDIYDDAVCKIITINGASVLLCEGSSESVPIDDHDFDIAIFTDGSRINDDDGAHIIDLGGEEQFVRIIIK